MKGEKREVGKWYSHIMRRMRAYAGLTRNLLFSIARYRSFHATLNSIDALWSQICCDIRNSIFRSGKVFCNVCGWSGAMFHPSRGLGSFGKGILCPVCESFPRQRLLAYYLTNATPLLAFPAVVLHVSPEKGISDLLLKRFGRGYISVDISSKRCPKVLSDLMLLGFKTNSFDMLLCFEVLEHLADDQAGMREILRVLKPGKHALITVPEDHRLEHTLERENPDPLDHFHFRLYGRDFPDRLRDMGFTIEVLSAKEIVPKDVSEKTKIGDTSIYIVRKPPL